MNTQSEPITSYQYGNIFYKLLWHDKNTFRKMIFVFIPFLLISILIIVLMNSDVFTFKLSDDQIKSGVKYFGIFDDLTNSFVLVYQLFFIYFASGKFLSYLGNHMRYFETQSMSDSHVAQKTAKGWRIAVLIFSLIVGVGAGTYFILNAHFASLAHPQVIYWYSRVGTGIVYFGALICFTLSMSTHFFSSIIVYMFLICRYRKRNFKESTEQEESERLKEIKSCCTLSMFFGFYSLISVATVFYSDIRAAGNYNVDFGLAGYSGGIVLIVTIFLATLYFGSIYIARYYIVNDYAKKVKMEKDDTEFPFNIDIGKVLVFIVSTVLPAITPWLQSML